ncbi:MAG: hypothetical protein V1817_04095, partial [Candidatus Micrarchaeota archaeon]
EKAGEAEAAANAAGVVWDARQTLLKTEEEQREKEKKEGKEKDALQRAMSEERELFSASLGEKEKELDLEDAFKKGAPNGAQFKPKEQKEQKLRQTPKKEFTPQQRQPQFEVDAVSKNEAELKKAIEAEIAKGAAMRVGENEVCELCRAPFKIAVGASAASAGATAKYGHCFCGAAYHKDCYETLARSEGESEGGGKCVRCGKKLKIAMDARSEEAVKQLKNVF